MDELNDFFSCSPNFKRETIPGGYVNGRVVLQPELFSQAPKREHRGHEYAEEYKQIELEAMKKV